MSKTSEELKQLKEEYEIFTTKLKELTEEELNIVTGGIEIDEHNLFLSAGLNNGESIFNIPGNNSNPKEFNFYDNSVDRNKFNN